MSINDSKWTLAVRRTPKGRFVRLDFVGTWQEARDHATTQAGATDIYVVVVTDERVQLDDGRWLPIHASKAQREAMAAREALIDETLALFNARADRFFDPLIPAARRVTAYRGDVRREAAAALVDHYGDAQQMRDAGYSPTTYPHEMYRRASFMFA